jgi:hypothetical protein
MSTFQRNISGGVNVPQTRGPVQSNSGIGDIAQLATAGANIYKVLKEGEKAELEIKQKAEQTAYEQKTAQVTMDYLVYKQQIRDDNPHAKPEELQIKWNTWLREKTDDPVMAMEVMAAGAEAKYGAQIINERKEELKAEQTYLTGLAQNHNFISQEHAKDALGDTWQYELALQDANKAAADRRHEVKSRELAMKKSEQDYGEKKARLDADKLLSDMRFSVTDGITVGVYEEEQRLIAQGVQKGTPEFTKHMNLFISKGRAGLAGTIADIETSISDPLTLSYFQKGHETIFKAYDAVAIPTMEYLADTKNMEYNAKLVEDIGNRSEIALLESDPSLARIFVLGSKNLVPPSVLQTIGIDAVGDAFESLSSLELPAPEGRPAYHQLYKANPTPEQKEKRETAVRDFNEIRKDYLDGKIEFFTDKEVDELLSGVSKSMQFAIDNPNMDGAFSENSIATVTEMVLHESYDSLPNKVKDEIKVDSRQWLAAMVGNSKSGFVTPVLEQAYSDLIAKIQPMGAVPSVEIGVNDETGELFVGIAGAGNIEDIARQTAASSLQPFGARDRFVSPGQQLEEEARNQAFIEKELMKFKRDLEGDELFGDSLKAVAKATGLELKAVTTMALNIMARSSNLPISDSVLWDEPEKPVVNGNEEKDKLLEETKAKLEKMEEEMAMIKSLSTEEFEEFRNA